MIRQNTNSQSLISNPKSPLPELSTRWDTVGAYQVFSRTCESAGRERLPVVLVHGLSVSSRYLMPTTRRLARNFRVYSPDLPGYGKSPMPPKVLNIDELADVLAAWMDVLELGPAYFVANSMGCQIVAALAQRQPERVRKAVLIGPAMDPTTHHFTGLLRRAVMNMLFEPLSFYPVLIHDYFAAGVHETLRALRYSIADKLDKRAPHVRCPVLVLRGSHDWLVTQPWAERVTSLLPDGRLEVIPHAAHAANYDRPDAVAARTLAFLG